MSQQMPKIEECSASVCAYNQDGNCCTLAINIGESEPKCDTYMASHLKGGMKGNVAGVGACKVKGCMHNEGLMCTANSVSLSMKGDQVMCATYQAL